MLQRRDYLFNLRDIEQSFEEAEQSTGVEYFHINVKVEVKIGRFVSLLEPCQEYGQVLACF